MEKDKRITKGEKTRIGILHAAISIIGENGLTEISTSKLAARSGMSKSTIFHHFKSTDELLLTTLDFIFDELLQAMTIEDYQDAEHFLHAIGQSIFQEPASNLTIFKAFLSFSHEAIFNEKYREVIVSYAEQMNKFFCAHLEKLLPQTNPKTIQSVARILLPLMDGIGFHYLLHDDSKKYQEIWELQVKSMIQYIHTLK